MMICVRDMAGPILRNLPETPRRLYGGAGLRCKAKAGGGRVWEGEAPAEPVPSRRRVLSGFMARREPRPPVKAKDERAARRPACPRIRSLLQEGHRMRR